MEIDLNFAVKQFFPTSSFVQIYYEAVANALDAGADDIQISIITTNKRNQNFEITITDNGHGFTDTRFEQFRRLAGPGDKHHKGLGRLVFLHYFSSVDVRSIFDKNVRTFTFSTSFKGHCAIQAAGVSDRSGTILKFSDFHRERLHSLSDLKPAVLKDKLIEQFLPVLYHMKRNSKAFKITIRSSAKGPHTQNSIFPEEEMISADDIPAFECKKIKDVRIDAFEEISMYYMVRPAAGKALHISAACIDGRTIPLNLISASAIPADQFAIFLFESELFNGNSDSARQKLELPDNVSQVVLNRVLRREMSLVLNERIQFIEATNLQTRQRFENRYPHLTGLFEDDTVGIIDQEEAIRDAQFRFFEQQKEILESDTLDAAKYEKALEVSSRTLMEYILYRELIIKRLATMGAENKEAEIHNLIVPQYERYQHHELTNGIYNNNAWLLDDKFMRFRTMLSEARMQELISAITLQEDRGEDDGRPDISMIFDADPTDVMKVDVVVVEIKKRFSNEKENTFASIQLTKRARKLVDHCPMIQRMWYFAIVEIDAALERILLDEEWTPLYSRGKIFYRERRLPRTDGIAVIAPMYLLSYDAIIHDAIARNHTFLEILKSGFKRTTVQQPD